MNHSWNERTDGRWQHLSANLQLAEMSCVALQCCLDVLDGCWGLTTVLISKMMTVGVGHSRRYCNTGYDQSQGRRPSTLKCIGPISKGDIEPNHPSEINPNSDSRSRSDGRSRRFVQHRVDQSQGQRPRSLFSPPTSRCISHMANTQKIIKKRWCSSWTMVIRPNFPHDQGQLLPHTNIHLKTIPNTITRVEVNVGIAQCTQSLRHCRHKIWLVYSFMFRQPADRKGN